MIEAARNSIPIAITKRTRRREEINVDPQDPYAQEEKDFTLALDRYKRVKRRPFPTLTEVLAVLHALGYRKVATAEMGDAPEQSQSMDGVQE